MFHTESDVELLDPKNGRQGFGLFLMIVGCFVMTLSVLGWLVGCEFEGAGPVTDRLDVVFVISGPVFFLAGFAIHRSGTTRKKK